MDMHLMVSMLDVFIIIHLIDLVNNGQKNDVFGCMIDLHDKIISFSLNGELMLDNFGSETAFDGFDMDDIGFVPILTSFSGQKARLNFERDVNTLKYFTSCSLQERYEPFCV